MLGLYPFQTNPYIPQQQQKTINYVSGKAGVESAFLPPNSGDVYIDPSAKKFYIKKTDASGAVTIETNDYTKSEEDKPIEYVTKAEFEIFKAAMKGVEHGSGTDNNDDNQQ